MHGKIAQMCGQSPWYITNQLWQNSSQVGMRHKFHTYIKSEIGRGFRKVWSINNFYTSKICWMRKVLVIITSFLVRIRGGGTLWACQLNTSGIAIQQIGYFHSSWFRDLIRAETTFFNFPKLQNYFSRFRFDQNGDSEFQSRTTGLEIEMTRNLLKDRDRGFGTGEFHWITGEFHWTTGELHWITGTEWR